MTRALPVISQTVLFISTIWLTSILLQKEIIQKELFLKLLSGIIITLCLFAIFEAFGITYPWSTDTRPVSLIGHRNELAHLACLGVLALLLLRKSTWYTAVTGFFPLTLIIFLCRTRSAWISLMLLILALLLRYFFSSKEFKNGSLQLIVGTLLSIIAVLIVPFNGLHWKQQNPFLNSYRNLTAIDEGSGAARLQVLKLGANLLRESNWRGIGTQGWDAALSNESQLHPWIVKPQRNQFPTPISDMVRFITEQGVLGFLLVSALIFVVAQKLYEAKNTRLEKPIFELSLIGFFLICLLSAVDSPLWRPSTAFVIASLTGLVFSYLPSAKTASRFCSEGHIVVLLALLIPGLLLALSLYDLRLSTMHRSPSALSLIFPQSSALNIQLFSSTTSAEGCANWKTILPLAQKIDPFNAYLKKLSDFCETINPTTP